MVNFELLKKDATGYSRLDTRHPDFDVRDPAIAKRLLDIYYKKSQRLLYSASVTKRFGFDKHLFEDIANEMYLMCLQGDKHKAGSQFLCFQAMRSIFGDPRYKNQASCLEYLPDFYENTNSENYEDIEKTTIANKFILELN